MIYLDETMFTFSTFRAKGWAHNRDRIRINDSNLRVTTLAVIAAISEEHGLIDYVVHPKAIKTEVFVAFISRETQRRRLFTVPGQPECAQDEGCEAFI